MKVPNFDVVVSISCNLIVVSFIEVLIINTVSYQLLADPVLSKADAV